MGGRSGGKRPSPAAAELARAIEAYRSPDLSERSDAEIEGVISELSRAIERLEAVRLRWVAQMDRRRSFARTGHLSTAAWLHDRVALPWGVARERVRTATALEHMPRTGRAVDAGEISLPEAGVLVEAREAAPEAFERDESSLVQAARRRSLSQLRSIAHAWTSAQELARGGDPDERRRARRHLFATPIPSGMVRVAGELDPGAGAALCTALSAVMDAEVRATPRGEDSRSAPQRRADALEEICRRWLDRTDRPEVAGERPHITLTVDLEALRRGRGGGPEHARPGTEPDPSPSRSSSSARRTADLASGERCELDHVGPVRDELARLLACDASVTRVVLAGASEPLDVGRRTPVVPPAVRRAVVVRDRTCRFPGCGRPGPWCDPHHVVHWADGGPTALANLILLCRPTTAACTSETAFA